jgi:Tfp pilus assembly protein PilN
VNDDIAAQQVTNASIESQISGLQKYADLQSQAQQQQQLLSEAYAGEVSYSGVMMDMSRVVPSDAYLSAMSVTTPGSTTTTGSTTTPATQFIGTMTTSGHAIGFKTLSLYLTSLAARDGWENPWMPSITADVDIQNSFTFTTSVDLSDAALTPRGAGAVSSGG